MATIKSVDFERSRAGRGIKTAAVVLVLMAGALAADQVFFASPSAHATAAPVTVSAAPVAASTDGFALPESLRHPTATDSGETPATF